MAASPPSMRLRDSYLLSNRNTQGIFRIGVQLQSQPLVTRVDMLSVHAGGGTPSAAGQPRVPGHELPVHVTETSRTDYWLPEMMNGELAWF